MTEPVDVDEIISGAVSRKKETAPWKKKHHEHLSDMEEIYGDTVSFNKAKNFG